MAVPELESSRPRRTAGLEVRALPDGGAEVTLARMRRVRVSPDALWLLEQLDGRRDARALAALLAERFGRDVSAADALELLRRTLVSHGLAALAPAGDPDATSPALRRQRRVELLRAEATRAWASHLAPLATPWAAVPLVGAALAALALATARITGTGAAAWRDPAGWALVVPLALAGSLAHELGHALALARSGGTPGPIALLISRRPRLAAELHGVDALPARARAGIDVAGVAAQVVVTGAAAALALAAGARMPAPALAAGVAVAISDLLPWPGSDGAWLIADLAGRDPVDTIWRPVSPARWLSRLALRLRSRALLALGRGPSQELARLMPVFVSASFPAWPPARLRRHARRHIEMQAVAQADLRAIGRARVDEARHLRPLRELRRQGRGAVVCAMHVGPYQHVPGALFELGCDVLAYAAPNQQRAWAEGWQEAARRGGARLEVLSPRSTRDAVRAVRAVRAGAMLYVLMDGQNASSRDQHRADFRFLGNDLYMRTGPALLARRADAPLVLAATRYVGVARCAVELSDPLPPPVDDSEAALVARTAEMYAWFEPRVARVAEQWDGWVLPLAHWRSTGGAPTATRAELDTATLRAGEALAGRPPGTRLGAEPTRVNWTGVGGEHLIVHGPERRVLVASETACALLDAAFRGAAVRSLPARLGAGAEALAPEIARLVLAGLVTLSQ